MHPRQFLFTPPFGALICLRIAPWATLRSGIAPVPLPVIRAELRQAAARFGLAGGEDRRLPGFQSIKRGAIPWQRKIRPLRRAVALRQMMPHKLGIGGLA